MTDNRLQAAHAAIHREDNAAAWPLLSDILNEDPENAEAIYLVGIIMRRQGHIGVALQLFRRALAIRNDIPNIWMHFGACLHDTHSYEEARECFQFVMKHLPDDPMPMANIAAGYVQQGKAREALEWAEKALAINPQHTIASIAKAFGCLSLGRWEEGWKYADKLYGEKVMTRVYTPNREPPWDGSPGKTVVVQADQGLGDMVMFAQCLPQMAQDCKKVIVETNERLAPLFARCFPMVDVYGTLKDQGIRWPKKYKIDAAIHISWLGKYYRKRDEDFPKQPYLTPHPGYVKAWREWLEQFPRPWVGIAWRGGIPETNTKARSMTLEDMAPVIEAGGTMINLCYQDVRLEIARWNIDHERQVHYPELDNEGDYERTVGLISQLDHVVTVTTTVAHVCGALGKRAYVLVNQIPQWRYAHGGDHLPWYPDSLRMYRQKPGETGWGHVVGRLAKDYRTWVLTASQVSSNSPAASLPRASASLSA